MFTVGPQIILMNLVRAIGNWYWHRTRDVSFANSIPCGGLCALQFAASGPAAPDAGADRCATHGTTLPLEAASVPIDVTALSDSLAPLVDHFNANAGKPRFVAVLSSTCPLCVSGAEAIQRSILDAFPDEDFSVSIIWIDMYPGDAMSAVNQIATRYTDRRVKQFYDVNQLAGNTISKSMLYKNAGPAWDIYLFFDGDAQWGDANPAPRDWVHQLSGGKRGDSARFRTGDDLVQQLRLSANAVLNTGEAATCST